MGKATRLVSKPGLVPDTDELVEAVVTGMLEKKGNSVVVMDLRPTGTGLADFFVVCHGDTAVQVEALARSVEDEVFKKCGESAIFKEGYTNSEWILIDYISVVVHIFLKDRREFYGIERFWADAAIRDVA